MGATYIPTPWKSATAQAIEDAMSEAVIGHIDERGLTAADIFRRYPSIRLEHLQKLRRGEPLGFRMLAALVEATGARINIRVNS